MARRSRTRLRRYGPGHPRCYCGLARGDCICHGRPGNWGTPDQADVMAAEHAEREQRWRDQHEQPPAFDLDMTEVEL